MDRNDDGREPRRPLRRPPEMGEMKRLADAQAPALRAQLRTIMRLDGLSVDDAARLAGLDAAALAAFLDGASLNPRWQERLARWLERASDGGAP